MDHRGGSRARHTATKYLLASALAVATLDASAQSVTVYGLVDSGVELVTHVAAVGDKRVFRVPTISGTLP